MGVTRTGFYYYSLQVGMVDVRVASFDPAAARAVDSPQPAPKEPSETREKVVFGIQSGTKFRKLLRWNKPLTLPKHERRVRLPPPAPSQKSPKSKT